ncbi:hypothetical protein [Kibdelosporangium phytohabitans]|uniref:HAF repeat-containing protein n=1 Tax=Kibdelosporangium phytohabitans TaxID=860235 RepID=A0A0N9I3I9_9PSEU|nr:hypothetical protein [Kibdelosporangium phytohabitans]ALG10624.1 hypothetical protein AOZ06_30340 [Kibdelosporangium phytohabitans]MBE1461742.1 putative membrane protein [Kibdelosporangium phytohabitans]
MRIGVTATLITALTSALAAAPPAAAGSSTITDLGTLPGDTSSTVSGLNQAGVVIGTSFARDASSVIIRERAVKWSADGVITALPLPANGTNPRSRPAGVNDSGVIAGSSYGGQAERALRWNTDNTVTVLDPLPGDTSSRATAVTADGTVVGHSLGPGRPTRAVRWSPGTTITQLPIPAGYTDSTGRAANDSNVVAGSTSGPNVPGRVLRWHPDGTSTDISAHVVIPYIINNSGAIAGWGNSSRGVRLDPDGSTVDLGSYAEPAAINATGAIAGNIGNIPYRHAARWAPDGTVSTLPSLPNDPYSLASDINDEGVTVGASSVLRSPFAMENHAVHWAASGAVTSLGFLPGGKASQAVFVNNAGTVAGWSDSAAGIRAVRWRL